MRLLVPLLTPASERSLWVKTSVIVLSLVFALGVRWLLEPLLHDRAPFALLLFATGFAAWIAGWRGGLIVTFLGGLIATYGFLVLGGTTGLPDSGESMLCLIFIVQGAVVSALTDILHRAVTRSHAAEKKASDFETMANRAEVFMWSTNAENWTVFVNRHWSTFTGRSMEAETNDRAESMHPEDRKRVRLHSEEHTVMRQPYRNEYRLRRSDGEYRWVLEHAVPRFSRDSAFEGYTGSCTDITSSRREREGLASIATLQQSLTRALDLDETLEALVQSVVPGVADGCSLHLIDDEGVLKPVRTHHAHPTTARQAALLEGLHRSRPDQTEGPARILREGESRMATTVTENLLRDLAVDEEHLELLRSLHLVSYLATPLRARDRIVGVLSIATAESKRIFGQDDLALAQKIAVIAAYALDNARLYETTRSALASEKQERRERYLSEEALDRQRLLLKTMIDAIPAMVAYIDDDERFLVHNRQYEKWMGVSYDQLHGRTLRELLGNEAYARNEGKLREAFAGNEVRFGYVMPTAAEPRHIVVTYRPDFDARHAVIGLVIHAYDITESSQLETAVVRSENRYRTLISATASIVWTTDAAGDMLGATGWQAFTGQTPEEFVGQGWLESVEPSDREGVRILWERTCRDRSTWDCAFRLRRADGTYRHIQSRGAVVTNSSGAIQEWIGTIVDIHDRVEAEQALHLKESELKLIVDAMPALVAYVHRDGTFGRTNQAYKKWFGIEPESMRNRPSSEILGEEAYAADRPRIAQVIAGEEVQFEERIRYRYGPPRWIGGTYVPHMNENFAVVGYVALIVDITERKRSERDLADALDAQRRAYADLAETRELLRHHASRLEEQVRHRTASLQESNAELEAFSYSVSHDLRTPLRFVRGFTEAIVEESGAALSEQTQDYLRRILTAAQRMDTIINDLLSYSRLSRAEMQIVEQSLEAIVGDVLTFQYAQIQQAKAAVIVDSPLPHVRADRTGLFQALSNLVSNALKFTSQDRPPVVRIRAESRFDHVRVWIEDNGIGIDPRHHDRIFKLFERLHGASEFPGTGIGLSLVRKAVQRMGGSCGVESTEGEGSRFWIDFPNSPGPSGTKASPT